MRTIRPLTIPLTVPLLIAALAVAAPAASAADAPATKQQLVSALGGDPARADAPRWDDLEKLDGRVQAASAYRLEHGRPAPRAVTGGVTTTPAGVLVDVYVEGNMADAAAQLRAKGMTVTAVSRQEPQRMVEGYLPPAMAPAVAGLDATRAVIASSRPVVRGVWPGAKLSQGDAAHHGPAARTAAGTAVGDSGFLAGAGVKVGVISDTIDKVGSGVAGSQASGDLPSGPAGVQVIQDGPASGSEDEGRAMAEIVYDEAPGATFAFATGITGAAQKAQNITALANNGAQVIADDIGYFDQPFFQDGIVAQAVDAAKARGVAYLSAAGNEDRQSWEGTGTNITQTLATYAASGTTVSAVLQWKETWSSAQNTFSVQLCDSLNHCTGQFSGSGGFPITAADLDVQTSGPVTIHIVRTGGSGTPLLKYLAYADANIDYGPALTFPTISPDASAAAGALAVAAVDAKGALTTPEPFSSRGPLTHYFTANGASTMVVRDKPEVAAADGVRTTVTGVQSPDGNFYGTSAATPSLAGIAAMIRSVRPSLDDLSVDDLYQILTNPLNGFALNCGAGDSHCGRFFVMADSALTQALTFVPGADSTPPTVTAVTDPGAPDGANGWFVHSVSVGWSVTDGQSAVTDQSGCDPQTVAADGIHTLQCTATSTGGTRAGTITIKRDTVPPAVPAIGGIKPQTYLAGAVPAKSALRCTSSDATSGLAGCSLTGYATGAGTHTITATATDTAGLARSSTLTYRVSTPAAISSLAVRAVSRSTLLSRGLSFSVDAAKSATKLTGTLTVKSGGRRVAVGTVTTTVGSGTRSVRLRLSSSGRSRVRKLHSPTLRLSVTGRATNAKTTTLTASTKARG